jgi:hypothetical protein|tara:strand:+ start:900 stop:1259 length:360 start_codon:yes stop_codon:yes gene_type:complete
MIQPLRQILIARAKTGNTISYQALAAALALRPPHIIQQLSQALEQTMWEDLAAERPFLAALVVSKRGTGLPAAGFFDCAQRTGRLRQTDPQADPQAAANFHAAELAAALAYWGQTDSLA